MIINKSAPPASTSTSITAHQGFFTKEALAAISATTLGSITAFARGEPLVHEVRKR